MARAEMHNMNDQELAQHLADAREEVFNLRFQLAMGKQDNSARLGHVRRDVARALTIQRQRELAANPQATPAKGPSSTAKRAHGQPSTAKRVPGRSSAKRSKVAR